MMERTSRERDFRPGHPTLIRWGAIIAGGVLGLAILISLSTLWIALAYGSDVAAIRDDLGWFLGGSAVISLFLASYLAGWMQGVRGWNPGMMAGVTLWAVTLLVTTLGAVPSLIGLIPGSVESTTPGQAEAIATSPTFEGPLWATFISIIAAFLASALGGALGGATPRSEAIYAPEGRPQLKERDVQVRVEPDETQTLDDDRTATTTTTTRNL